MRKRYVFTVLTLTICLAWLKLSPVSAVTYKWVDDEGETHYSQVPPVGKATNRIEPPPAPPPPAPGYSLQELKQRTEKLEASREEAAQKHQRLAEQQALKEENCRRARKNLNTLLNSGRVRYADEAGNLLIMPEEERQARITEVQGQVDEFCK